MKMHSTYLLATITSYLSYIFCSVEVPSWHLKPLGSHIEPEKVDETFADNLISPKDFGSKYVLPRKPLVFRNIVREWPAFKLWTDDYMKETYGELELRIEGKREKQSGIPKGDICLGRDHMKTFLNEYKEGANKYVVTDLPKPMWHEVNVPPSMACGEFLKRYVEIDLWMNSDLGKNGQGGNSILHKDAFNTVNCVINGTKEWKLIELQYNDYVYQSWEGPMDAGYGGFSLVNPEQVDALKYPDIGKIPRWQFTKIDAGDCLYLPSQMWHQVKSFGETNRAVAFLFSKFDNDREINTTNCPNTPKSVPLSEVDVDWQYPGYGIMPMGNGEISEMKDLLFRTIDKKKAVITKKKIYALVHHIHSGGAKNKVLWAKKSKSMYEYLLKIANGKPEIMTRSFIESLTRDNIRDMVYWIFPVEPANSYEHEYSYILPEQILHIIDETLKANNGKLVKEVFLKSYQGLGGTIKFAEDLWEKVAGDKDTTDENELINEKLQLVIQKYEYYRREDPYEEHDDDETIETPQGHKTQPKKAQGGYENTRQENENMQIRDEL